MVEIRHKPRITTEVVLGWRSSGNTASRHGDGGMILCIRVLRVVYLCFTDVIMFTWLSWDSKQQYIAASDVRKCRIINTNGVLSTYLAFNIPKVGTVPYPWLLMFSGPLFTCISTGKRGLCLGCCGYTVCDESGAIVWQLDEAVHAHRKSHSRNGGNG